MKPHRPQPLPIRLLHWLNVWFLLVMAGSGLQILVAYPMLGPRGAPFGWYPFQGKPPPAGLTLGGWLAGARHYHFAFMWLFVITGLVYVIYLASSGEWRRRLFLPRRDFGNAVETAKYYLRLRRMPPEQGLYNGLQRFAYSGTLLIALVAIVSGLGIYKPVQLGPLTRLLGGYDAARAIHFLALVAFVIFVIGHLILVLLHPRALAAIFTGGTMEENPEPVRWEREPHEEAPRG